MANTKVFEWSGEAVELNERQQFYVPLVERTYDTAQEAKDAIGRRLAQQQKVAKRKLALAIVDQDGVQRKIVSIHKGNGSFIFDPKPEEQSRYRTTYEYPDVEWVRDALAEAIRLNKAAKELTSVLDNFRISHYSKGYGQEINITQVINQTEKNYNECLGRATATTLEKEVANLKAEPKKRLRL